MGTQNNSDIHVEATISDYNGFITTYDYTSAQDGTALAINKVGAASRLKLINGNNTITIPVGSRGVIITCNSLCNTNKILKGIAGDVGIPILSTLAIGKNKGSFILLFGDTVGTSFVINSSALDTDFTEFWFF